MENNNNMTPTPWEIGEFGIKSKSLNWYLASGDEITKPDCEVIAQGYASAGWGMALGDIKHCVDTAKVILEEANK